MTSAVMHSAVSGVAGKQAARTAAHSPRCMRAATWQQKTTRSHSSSTRCFTPTFFMQACMASGSKSVMLSGDISSNRCWQSLTCFHPACAFVQASPLWSSASTLVPSSLCSKAFDLLLFSFCLCLFLCISFTYILNLSICIYFGKPSTK